MARVPGGEFVEHVEGVGTFVFKQRTMRDNLRIHAEYARLTEGVINPGQYLAEWSDVMSVLHVLTQKAPPGWDLESFDPLDDDTYIKLAKVFGALRAREVTFRQGATEAVAPPRAGDGAESGVLVSPEIQPRSD